MQHRTCVPILLVAAVIATSCSDSGSRRSPTQPTQFNTLTTGSSISVQPTSPTVIAQPVKNPSCPTVAPFLVTFAVIVRPTAVVTVVVTEIALQFTDVFGVRLPQVTSPAPLPTVQFGTLLVQARGQTIPLVLGIGCGTSRRGTILVRVQTRDGNGRTGSAQTTIGVE